MEYILSWLSGEWQSRKSFIIKFHTFVVIVMITQWWLLEYVSLIKYFGSGASEIKLHVWHCMSVKLRLLIAQFQITTTKQSAWLFIKSFFFQKNWKWGSKIRKSDISFNYKANLWLMGGSSFSSHLNKVAKHITTCGWRKFIYLPETFGRETIGAMRLCPNATHVFVKQEWQSCVNLHQFLSKWCVIERTCRQNSKHLCSENFGILKFMHPH